MSTSREPVKLQWVTPSARPEQIEAGPQWDRVPGKDGGDSKGLGATSQICNYRVKSSPFCTPGCSITPLASDSLRPHGRKARQPPLSMGVSRQEHWSGLPCSPPGDLPDPGIEPTSPVSLALQADTLPLSPRVSPGRHYQSLAAFMNSQQTSLINGYFSASLADILNQWSPFWLGP